MNVDKNYNIFFKFGNFTLLFRSIKLNKLIFYFHTLLQTLGSRLLQPFTSSRFPRSVLIRFRTVRISSRLSVILSIPLQIRCLDFNILFDTLLVSLKTEKFVEFLTCRYNFTVAVSFRRCYI